MKLTVKTLKGGKFEVDCEPSNSIAEVKEIIVSHLSPQAGLDRDYFSVNVGTTYSLKSNQLLLFLVLVLLFLL
jgi:hypothetical protein